MRTLAFGALLPSLVWACAGEASSVEDANPQPSANAGDAAGGAAPDLALDTPCPLLEPAPDQGCGPWKVPGPFSERLGRVLLVVEHSSRLLDPLPDATGDQWAALSFGLSAALDRAVNNLGFAMMFYPSPVSTGDCGPTCCSVLPADSAVRGPIARDNIPRIIEVLLSSPPEGQSPVAAALTTARDYLTRIDVSDDGDVYVVLVTDGGPDCGSMTCDSASCVPNIDGRCQTDDNCCADDVASCLDDLAVSDQIQSLGAAGIETFVVGLAGASEFANSFDAYRQVGAHTYSTAGSQTEVEETMMAIFTTMAQRCQTDFPMNVSDPTVFVDCELFPDVGVDVESPSDTTRLVLQGEVCARLLQPTPPEVGLLSACAGL